MLNQVLAAEDVLFLHKVRDKVKTRMHGIDGIINLLLVALVTRGHVLLEGNPGLGKTALIRALTDAMDMPREDMGRIQFTPDLMPSDITGTRLPVDGEGLQFVEGPVFCKLLLADEINRATPKTQAAMLEAMAEFQVTVLGKRYELTQLREVRDGNELTVRTPFMVMATQNPIEQEGTYELPEAQLDRFLFKALMPFPSRETLAAIVQKDAGPRSLDSAVPPTQAPQDTDKILASLHRVGRAIREAQPSEDVRMHILNIIMASVGEFTEVKGLSAQALEALKTFCDDHVEYELGPRAATSLTLATLGWTVIAELNPREVSQLQAKSADSLAKVALPVLRHRMRFHMPFGNQDELPSHDDLVRQFVGLCAPQADGYASSFAAALNSAKATRF